MQVLQSVVKLARFDYIRQEIFYNYSIENIFLKKFRYFTEQAEQFYAVPVQVEH